MGNYKIYLNSEGTIQNQLETEAHYATEAKEYLSANNAARVRQLELVLKNEADKATIEKYVSGQNYSFDRLSNRQLLILSYSLNFPPNEHEYHTVKLPKSDILDALPNYPDVVKAKLADDVAELRTRALLLKYKQRVEPVQYLKDAFISNIVLQVLTFTDKPLPPRLRAMLSTDQMADALIIEHEMQNFSVAKGPGFADFMEQVNREEKPDPAMHEKIALRRKKIKQTTFYETLKKAEDFFESLPENINSLFDQYPDIRQFIDIALATHTLNGTPEIPPL